MVELAGSLGINISQPARKEARRLKPLAYSEKKETHKAVKKYSPAAKLRYRDRAIATSWRRTLRNADIRLIGALMLLMVGLFFLLVYGRGFALSCHRIE